jgi:hypothetical protein
LKISIAFGVMTCLPPVSNTVTIIPASQRRSPSSNRKVLGTAPLVFKSLTIIPPNPQAFHHHTLGDADYGETL